MARILEKVNECWNDVNVIQNNSSLNQPQNRVTIYRRRSRGEISDSFWDNEARDSSNLILLERGKYSSIHLKYSQYFI